MDKFNFGEVVRICMAKKGISQTELAEKIGINRRTLNNYLTDITRPDIDVLIKICQHLEIDVNALLKLHENNHDDMIILNSDEYKIVSFYRSLPDEESRIKFMKILNFIINDIF